jgi:hypothetical protein
MPRFYFDVVDENSNIQDDIGVELARVADAKLEAAIALASMMAEAISKPTPHIMFIVIRDETRKPIAKLTISLDTKDLA